MIEPRLNRHDWETEWHSLEEEHADSPAGTLPAIDDLVDRMLLERGYSVSGPVAR